MPTYDTTIESVKVRVSSRSSLVDRMQEITLLATLDHAIGQVADCFDSCNRKAEPGSVSSQQAEACEEDYDAVADHQTTITYTNNFAKNFIHSGLDYLKGAAAAVLDTGSAVRWSSLALTRSLIEASAACSWLVDPALDLDTRLRRTNQMFVRDCKAMLHILPDGKETTPRFVSVDPIAKAICERARDAALKWARAQGWKCGNGKEISLNRWIGEIPSHTEAVALAGQGEEPGYWKDMYRTLSGVIHSQTPLMSLAISDEPDAFFDRALMVLDIGISFYTHTLRQYAEFMGWHDHDIDNWFGPVHATLQHMRAPEDVPLPVARVRPDRCEVCPDYQDPGMHRLALVSHLCALWESNIDLGNTGDAEAPTRYSFAVEFLDKLEQMIENGNDADPEIQELLTALGYGHIGVHTLLGSDSSEVRTSIAASWAVLSSPGYQSNVGTMLGWESQSDDTSRTIPFGNE